MFDELAHHKDERFTTPPRWEALMEAVSEAASLHLFNPDHPLQTIGRFEALATRGLGGFGVVFKVRDPELDRLVALKLCMTRGPESAEGLMNEARVLAKLSHPNIVSIHEPGREGDDVFFVMEFVDGVNAHDFVRDEDPPWPEVVDVYRGAGRGLAAAHDAGIVHGDFKPSNILLDAELWPRVADFGLAQVIADHLAGEELRHRPGTLPFMAPEVLRGQAGDPLSDQWSFCVSLWQGLEHGLPYDGWTPAELLESIERGEPWVLQPAVPEAVRSVVRRGLSVDPAQRYPDMHALVAELDKLRERPGASQETGLDAPAVVPGSSKVTEARRRPFVLGLLLTGAALLGAWGVEHVPWAETDPDPAEASPPEQEGCALWELPPLEPSPEVQSICRLIRDGDYRSANSLWEAVHDARLRNPSTSGIEGYTHLDLALDTIIVAQTFAEAAVDLESSQSPKDTAATEEATYPAVVLMAEQWANAASVASDAHGATERAGAPPAVGAAPVTLEEIEVQVGEVYRHLEKT
ncbi:Serine/threonine-protein kinase PrkC [Enhygromyxa salina]|uniref:Serine/threonine-protein kinase PrkC n=1 Tax=Enhygromyxa salina TaxID=215803 RepID=A0A2S9XK88_9BACT|nr:Serine/threonine-protein kinase PrkC [Enhygromyxa salina]